MIFEELILTKKGLVSMMIVILSTKASKREETMKVGKVLFQIPHPE